MSKTKQPPRTARMSVRVRPQAALILRGVAAFHKQTVAGYVRAAIGKHVEEDLELTARCMSISGYSRRRISREIKAIVAGGVPAKGKR